jgi:hypothetical protein
MRKRFVLLFAAGLVPWTSALASLASGCGDSVFTPDGDDVGAGGGGGPTTTTTTTTTTTSGGPADAFPDYVDPGCPDAGPPVTAFACDPYTQGNGDCPPGEGCYIFVDYPDEPCGQETYGSMCSPEGWGHQGDACGGSFECAGGFVCVISGSGTQCIELCSLDGEDGCPAGLVCEPIDVEGFGGCL